MTSTSNDGPLWVIYGLRLVDDSEYRYVGYTTVGVVRRLRKHLLDTRHRDFHVQRWIRSVGLENVTIDVLEECPEGDTRYISEAEEFWICQIRAFGHSLTNLNAGGVGGNSERRHSEETKAKISLSLRTNPNFPRGESHPNFGVPLSESTKIKMSASLTGNRHSAETRKLMSDLALVRDDSNRQVKVKLANHTRWHVKRNVIKEDCIHCS